IGLAIAKLGHADFATRERATAELKTYRDRAYPFLVKAMKSEDPEVVKRVEEAMKFIQAKVPASQLEPREFDVIYTDDSSFTGRLTAHSIRVATSMFGEQPLKLSDLRSLGPQARSGGDNLAGALPAPATLMAYQQQYGKEVLFAITGYTTNQAQPPV